MSRSKTPDDRDIEPSLKRFRKYGRPKGESLVRDDDRLPVPGVFFDHDGNEVDPEEVGLNADVFADTIRKVYSLDE
ncbi:hypothetical protein HY463_00925 [Candidatus Peregrinibacteria bacterium]|nr:hypothetical protein [Candidatus Peregrinibacteria bacterium]